MNKIKEANTKPKKKRYKYIIYIVLILSLTTLVLYFSLRGTITYNGEELPTFVAIGKIFTEIDVGYFFVFFGLLILNNLLGAFALFLFARLYTKKYKYHQALANQMIGVFYNDITPGSNSGGQFAQAITFKKQGMNISNAASVMVMQFIVYQSCLFILGLISLFKIDTILDIQIIRIGSVDIPIIIFIILGFLLNLIVISSMYFMSYSRWFHNLITNNLMDLLGKIHVIKNVEEKKLQLRVQVENFRIELRRLISNIPFTILIYIITMLMLIINDLYPFFIGLALNGFDKNNFILWNHIFESVVYSNYHQLICGLIPIPGSAGVSEFVFSSLFSKYYSSEFIMNGGAKASMLLWRTFTYYVPFIFGALVASTYKSKGVKTVDKFYPLERKTFITLQLETYEERKTSSDLIYQTKSLERKELLKKLKKSQNDNKSEGGNDENRNIH